jgi:YD repeat-containing protein
MSSYFLKLFYKTTLYFFLQIIRKICNSMLFFRNRHGKLTTLYIVRYRFRYQIGIYNSLKQRVPLFPLRRFGYNTFMGSRYPLAAALFLAFACMVSAQTAPAAPAPANPATQAAAPAETADDSAEDTSSGLFSLSALIDTAISGSLLWRPDWPLAIPPDSFTPASQEAERDVSITLTLGIADTPEATDQGAEDTVPVEFWYTLEPTGSREPTGSQDNGGKLSNFPYFINGVLCQVQAFFYGQNRALTGLRVIGEGDPWEIEFTRLNDEGLPLMGRVSRSGAYSFVVFQYLGRETTETWYDEAGTALGFFSLKYQELNGRFLGTGRFLVSVENRGGETSLVTTYDYDSAGKISAVSAPEGNYAALYTAEGRLRYWEKPGASYTLQWDEEGFLTRLTGTVLEEEVNMVYEYTSTQGNWTERRELPLLRRFGILAPGPGLLARRSIEYGTR